MALMQMCGVLLLGLLAGVMAGMFGIGGGMIIVPGLSFIIGLNSKMCAGTSLAAMLLPFGILGFIEYYKSGSVNVPAALLLVTGLFLGTFFGAKITLSLPDLMVKRLFGMFLFLMSVRYLTFK